MKSIAKFLLFAGAALIAVQATAKAETTWCAIPFAFQAAGVTLPAGEYTLTTDLNSPNIVLVRNGVGRPVALLAGMRGARGDGQPLTVQFNRYGESYFLREVRLDGNSAWYFPGGKAEREAAGGRTPTVALVIGILRH